MNRKTTEEICGERVRLRYWQVQDDAEQRLWPRYTDPLHTLWNMPRTTSLYGSLFPFSTSSSSIRRMWAIEDSQRSLIGRISLRDVERYSGRARLGISLSASHVGQGLGSEALNLFLDHFFGPLGFHTMVLDVAAFNQRAVNCYRRLGFRHVGDDWRKSSNESCIRSLDDPMLHDLRIYFRRERFVLWVQFMDMELHRNEWLERRGGAQPYAARAAAR